MIEKVNHIDVWMTCIAGEGKAGADRLKLSGRKYLLFSQSGFSDWTMEQQEKEDVLSMDLEEMYQKTSSILVASLCRITLFIDTLKILGCGLGKRPIIICVTPCCLASNEGGHINGQ